MRLTRFSTVRGRLLALLVAIALPIACLTAITAVTTYQTVLSAIRSGQLRVADDYAVRTRVWYRGNLRALLAAGSVLTLRQDASCSDLAAVMLGQTVGFRAVQVSGQEGAACGASLDAGVSMADVSAVRIALAALPPVRVWAGVELADVRYDVVSLGGQRYFAVYARHADASHPMREGLLLIAAELLDTVFDLGEADAGFKIALVSRSEGPLVVRGADEQDGSWLPRQPLDFGQAMRWDAPSRAGGTRAYAARMVAEPDFYVLASFDDRAESAALTQFLILLLTPLVTLGLLCVVYLRAIDQHCIRWLRAIEAAARARSTLSSARAVVADEMPADIRSVAEAFNGMVDEQEVRQRKLQTALDDNRFLVRELHHRVKNSLQVVQSYIGLTKRDYRGEARVALSDAECRVHVLSAAYRFTLADGEMQPVRVDLFLDDVVTMISNLLRNRDQWISSTLDTQATLSVDRIIPLGFLIVDVVSRALRDTQTVSVAVAARDHPEGGIEIEITADRDLPASEPPKLFAGLVAQIEAVQTIRPDGRALGAWRIGIAD